MQATTTTLVSREALTLPAKKKIVRQTNKCNAVISPEAYVRCSRILLCQNADGTTTGMTHATIEAQHVLSVLLT